jgi:hypothetical protein
VVEYIGTNSAGFNSAPKSGSVERIDGRQYRRAPVRGRKLPTALVRSIGLLSHMGTPREELPILARALHIDHVTAESDSEAVRYWNQHTGTLETVERIAGTFQKSAQGFTEDIRRRIWKKITPDGLESADARRDYERHRHATRRAAPYLVDVGPAVPHPDKRRRDFNGRRWAVAEELRDMPVAPDPAPLVRCTGPEPHVNWNALHIDVLDALERIVAHREQLHRQFTEGKAATSRDDDDRAGLSLTKHRAVDAQRSHQWHARHGSDRAAFVSVGRWRKGESAHADERPAVTVPWIVFEIDGRDDDGQKSRTRTAELARRLVRRLLTYTGTADALHLSYTGSTSIHVRLSHAAVGCPVYTSERDAAAALSALVDGICAGMPEVRAAIDDACLRPRQLIRCIGSTHRHGGRCIPLTVEDLLHADPLTWWGRSEAMPHEPYILPDPHTSTTFSPALYRLLTAHSTERQTPAEPLPAKHCCKPLNSTGTIAPIRDGVEEGRRNDSAYLMALYLLTNGREPPGSAWEHLKRWNGRCSPPLPVAELRVCYTSATRSRAVRAQESKQPIDTRREQ